MCSCVVHHVWYVFVWFKHGFHRIILQAMTDMKMRSLSALFVPTNLQWVWKNLEQVVFVKEKSRFVWILIYFLHVSFAVFSFSGGNL